MKIDFFAEKAGSYEQNKGIVENIDNIATSILQAVKLKNTMHIMDFGSGTGLLLERISPYVGKITAVDISNSMNRQLNGKRGRLACDIEIKEIDLEKSDLEQKYNGIISSMTMHHIQNIEAMFEKFYLMLDNGGFIAISDLDREDGSFHTEDTGVFHFGFERDEISKAALKAGFRDIDVTSTSFVHKPQGDYPVFLLTAVR